MMMRQSPIRRSFMTVFEDGFDACGTSARQAKLMFGIDIFLDGGVA